MSANAKRMILLLGTLLAGAFLCWYPLPFLHYLVVILVITTGLWLVSLPLKNASIIDIFWSIGFLVLAGFASWFHRDQLVTRDIILLSLVTVWSLRLAIHLAKRNLGHGEDARYAKWREENGKRWWWQSWLQVFVLQGLLIWVVGAVLVVSLSHSGEARWPWLDYVGLALWCVGLYFEAVGDWQLTRFKKNRESDNEVLDSGLWSLSRHPNYFGDALVWWGYFCFALATGPNGLWFIFSPIMMTFLLRWVSGASLLESDLEDRKPAYRQYMQSTPAFFPRLWPKKK